MRAGKSERERERRGESGSERGGAEKGDEEDYTDGTKIE